MALFLQVFGAVCLAALVLVGGFLAYIFLLVHRAERQQERRFGDATRP